MARSPEVDAWFAAYEHPLRDVMQQVRTVVLDADPQITECIKWKTPTFAYKGNIFSFQPRAKRFVSLLFHSGAKIPGEHPLLLGDGDVVRTMRFEDADAVAADAEGLVAVLRAWCVMRDA